MDKVRRAVSFAIVVLFSLWTLYLWGCASKEKYSYDQIKATYEVMKPFPSSGVPGTVDVDARLPSDPLSLKDAVKLGLYNNPKIDQAVARIHQSEAMIDQAQASFWPVISTYGEYLQGDAPSAYLFKTIDQRKLPPQVDFNDPGWFENYELGIEGRINLFNGGRDVLRKIMAETGLRINQLGRETVENALIASVIQAYFNTLATREYIQIARESVATVKTQLRIMRVRFEAGGALRSDILSLRVRLAQAEEDLVRADNNFSLSVAALANLLGLDPDTSLTLKGEEDTPKEFPSDYRTGLVYALEHRPELRQVREEIVQSRMAVDMARSQYLPRVDARMKYYVDDESLDFERERENWTAGILLQWDLFTGLSTKAEVRKTEAALEEMLALDRQTANAIQLDLKTAYLKLAEARARLDVAQASVEEARESLKLVKRQYEGGSATITRYLDAELAHNRSRIRSTAAYYDREKALAELGRALGYWEGYAKEVRKSHD